MVSKTYGEVANGKDASAEMCKPEDNATESIWEDLIFESDEESLSGTWCLRSDFARRPSMSEVVKVFEGLVDVEDDMEYNYSYSPLPPKFGGLGNKAADVATVVVVLLFFIRTKVTRN